MTGAGALEKRIGYVFCNKALLQEALTHASAVAGRETRTYERLEFLGDRVLGLIIAAALYKTYSNDNEGELATRFTALVRAECCAAIAQHIDIGAALHVGESEDVSGGRSKQTLLADACEALIGALYLDGGMAVAEAFVLRFWSSAIANPPARLRDAKTLLQEWAQARGLPLPVYDVVARSGPDHAPEFRVAVHVQGLAPHEAFGPSKRLAEQAAAQALIDRDTLEVA